MTTNVDKLIDEALLGVNDECYDLSDREDIEMISVRHQKLAKALKVALSALGSVLHPRCGEALQEIEKIAVG